MQGPPKVSGQRGLPVSLDIDMKTPRVSSSEKGGADDMRKEECEVMLVTLCISARPS